MANVAPVVSRTILAAAQDGDPGSLWTVYEHFYAYARAYGLHEVQHHEFLRRAMQGGHADAQFEVAKLLRGGWLSMNSDGSLRVVNQDPTQHDIDHARDLVGLAAAQGEEHARHMLENLPAEEWQARTMHRSPFGVHAELIHTPLEEAEADQVTPASTHYLWYALVVVAAVLLLWAAWGLYAAKLAQV